MILITGGTGYLAGIVAHYFAEKGYLVRVGTRKKELVSKALNNNIDVVDLDLLNKESINNAIRDISYVFHFASMNYEDCKKDPIQARIVNEECTQKILNASIEENVKKIIYFSTMHVYGANLEGNVTEQTVPAPQSIYGKTHLNAEKIVEDLSIRKNIEYLILRLSNVSSPPLSTDVNCWHLVIHDLCLQVMKNRKIKLRSNGEQYRDFVHINMVNNALDYFINNSGLSGVYNFGSGNRIRIKEVAKIIQREFEKIYSITPEIFFGEKKIIEKEFSYNIDKLKKSFPFNDSLSPEYIIKELLFYCKNNFY